jgi:hypothetical protein
MKRYSILAREYGSNHEVELCQVDANADEVARALEAKTLRVFVTGKRGATRKSSVPKYTNVRIVENQIA